VPGRRERSRRVSTGLLVTIAVVVAAVAMAGMTAKAVIARASCSNKPILVNLAASFDIAPAIQTIARSFNNQDISAAGQCVEVQVTPGEPSAVAAQIDGQDSLHGLAPVDAWIPDSSLWVDEARSYPVGAQVIQAAGFSIAKSPILLVTSQQVATATHVFTGPASWNLLNPSSYGGPPASLGLSADIPDPTDSAVGLSTLIQLNRELGNTVSGRAGLTKFVFTAEDTADFDSVTGLGEFVASTGAPFYRRAIAEASEQSVILYDRANPRQPIVARYPTGPAKAFGSPELDYPYVVTASSRAMSQAASAFGTYLRGAYAQSVIRYDGFRSAAGVADAFPANSGLSQQQLQIATAPSASEAATTLVSWQKLGLGSKDITVIDDSAAMGAPTGVDSLTLEQMLAATAAHGLALFPDSTNMSLWETPDSLSASVPYRDLVSMGPLPAQYGLITRREQLQEIIQTLTTTSRHPLHLYDTILAAYKQMTATYAPKYSNAVLVLTAGVDQPGDMALTSLLSQLQKLNNPNKKVEIVILQFGEAGDFTAMKQIATATDGVAYQILNPVEIGKIFIEAIAHRMCDQGCAP
jgi:Ca-activated chloride channel family protein